MEDIFKALDEGMDITTVEVKTGNNPFFIKLTETHG